MSITNERPTMYTLEEVYSQHRDWLTDGKHRITTNTNRQIAGISLRSDLDMGVSFLSLYTIQAVSGVKDLVGGNFPVFVSEIS